MTIIGIDLGTTNSACSVWKDGKPVLIPNRLGNLLTPSVVGLDEGGEILIGESAKYRLISHPNQTTAVFKRYMGSQHEVSLGKRKYTAPELSALILRSLKDDAEAFCGEEIKQAIISVPAYFNDAQRKATKLAGELAGLEVERLINEPTAAAIMYGLHESKDGTQYMILDMGGGTFDVSIVEYFDGVLEVHASSGDNHLGGEDFLNAMIQRFIEDNEIKEKSLKATERQHLIDQMDTAKRKLSTEHKISLSNIVAGQNQPWSLDRAEFEQLVQPLLHRIQVPIERTLRDSDLSPADIDEIVLVGGATRMLCFRSLVTKMFRRMPSGNIDPDLVVAMGAGIQAGMKQKHKDLDDVVLTDVSPYSLGVGIINENDTQDRQGDLFLPIIERNSIVPVSVERSLCTTSDNQTAMRIKVYQGESRLVKNNIYLGELEVTVPKGPAGKELIDVRYSYDMNGILEVDVAVVSTSKKLSKTIINSSSSLSEDEVLKSHEKLSRLKFHPRENEENRHIIARAERLYESSLSEDREYISNLLSFFEKTLEKQDPAEIKRAVKKMNEALESIEGGNVFS